MYACTEDVFDQHLLTNHSHDCRITASFFNQVLHNLHMACKSSGIQWGPLELHEKTNACTKVCVHVLLDYILSEHLLISLVCFTVEPLQKLLQHLQMTIVGSKVHYRPAMLRMDSINVQNNHQIHRVQYAA